MAISDNQKVDYLWKKLGYSASKTDTSANKKAPNEAISSPLQMRGDKVMKDSGSIPGTQPGSSAGVLTVYPSSAPIECTEDITATASRTWKTGQTDWVSPEFGSTYQVKVYIHTSNDAAGTSSGTQVYATGSGNDDEWFFDYQSGILHFIGTNLPNGVNFSGKSVYIAGSRYSGTFGVGGDLGDYVFATNTMAVGAGDPIVMDNATGLVLPSGTTAERNGTPTTGEIRWSETNVMLEVWDGTQWATVGGSIANITANEFDGDGTTTSFSLSASSTTDATFVAINGVVQEAGTDYTVSGSTLTFTTAPIVSDRIQVRNLFKGNTVDFNTSLIQDADSDTKIQVEETADEDTVRIDVAGSEVVTVTASTTTVTNDLSSTGDFTYVPRLTYWHLSSNWTVSNTTIKNWSKQTSGVYYNDTGITYNNTTGAFTFTEAGIYRINLSIELTGGSEDYATYALRKNSTNYGNLQIIRQVTRGAQGSTQTFASRVMQVSANDTFDISIIGNSGGSIASNYTTLEFEKIG